MAENQTNNTSSDEVDLGQLFELIGRAFEKLFNFIGSIFKGLFHSLILLLLFLQKHFLILAITVVLGVVGGYFLDKYKTPKYISRMVVEPNFNSAQQLYNNLDFYNDLAKTKDSTALASFLNISENEASSIKKISVEPYSNENQKIKLFDSFIRGLDTTTVKALDFENFIKNFNPISASFHQVSVIATNNTVAKKLQPAIVGSISANDYFKLQKNITDENLSLQDLIINNQLVEIDSLQKIYNNVLVKEADKPMQGTNINLAESGGGQNKELALIRERESLKNQLVRLNEQRANKSEILNVISDFPVRGVKVKGFWNNYKFVMPLILVGFNLLVLLLLGLNSYLKNYVVKTS